ncbi:MAG: helix-turn-helix domain-containing protein [Alphaproteobacteria bacterium]|nr:helix-turn-helix domain-containing protein [Alphaproteobacteria bacterium]
MISFNFLTTAEVADLLRIRKNTIERWRVSRTCPIPWTKIGGRVLYQKQDILNYLDCQKRTSNHRIYGD